MIERSFSRVLLIGFMGAGKSSVGRSLASSLDWRFADFDATVESELGLTVSEIFAEHGEGVFREAEARVARRLLSQRKVVLGSGGGWAASPGRLVDLPEGTESVWLEVGAEEALRRVSDQPDERPLLAGPDPLETARALLAARSPFYAAAKWRVDTEGYTVEDVSARILRLLTKSEPEAGPE